jgi:hypothetical protein
MVARKRRLSPNHAISVPTGCRRADHHGHSGPLWPGVAVAQEAVRMRHSTTQNPVLREGGEGSIPSFGTNFLAALGAFRERLALALVSTSGPLPPLSADTCRRRVPVLAARAAEKQQCRSSAHEAFSAQSRRAAIADVQGTRRQDGVCCLIEVMRVRLRQPHFRRSARSRSQQADESLIFCSLCTPE